MAEEKPKTPKERRKALLSQMDDWVADIDEVLGVESVTLAPTETA